MNIPHPVLPRVPHRTATPCVALHVQRCTVLRKCRNVCVSIYIPYAYIFMRMSKCKCVYECASTYGCHGNSTGVKVCNSAGGEATVPV